MSSMVTERDVAANLLMAVPYMLYMLSSLHLRAMLHLADKGTGSQLNAFGES
jgi:hypothetical protein